MTSISMSHVSYKRVLFWGGIILPKPPSLYQLVRWQIACGILYSPVVIYIQMKIVKQMKMHA